MSGSIKDNKSNLKPDAELTEHRECIRELDYQIKSNRALIYICSFEEPRIIDAIRLICTRGTRKDWEVYSWDLAAGLYSLSENANIPSGAESMDQLGVLQWFRDAKPKDINKIGAYQILILKDFQKLIGADGNAGQIEYTVIRELRNQAQEHSIKQKCIIILGTSLFLPPEIEKLCSVIDWPFPERYHIRQKLDNYLAVGKQYDNFNEKCKLDYTEEEKNEIVTALQGLSVSEIELLSSYMLLRYNKFDPVEIIKHKKEIIRKSGLLDWVKNEEGLNSVGGLYALKDWVVKRKDAFTVEAKAFGLPANPAGVLLVGIQGAGKSLAAKAIATYMNLPLLRLDMGKIFSGIVGSSEENIRTTIKVAESISPCILWLDEIDKGFSGSKSSNNTDGGTAARVLGSFLNWMQEKEKPVYIAATANDISELPPELLRKGRFDEIFFVDLPDEEERAEIYKIHLEKRSRSVESFDLNKLVTQSAGFTGAEIESSIIAALYEAFSDGKREMVTKDILDSLHEMTPLSVTMSENINALREWAAKRARNASSSKSFNYDKVKKEEIINHNIPMINEDDEL